MRTQDLDYLDSLPSFEPIHARRALDIEQAAPRKRMKPWTRNRKPQSETEN